MDPNAVHESETKHDHQHQRTAVTDQRQRHTGDWQHRNGHSHVLENVRENKSGDPHDQKQTQLITGKKSNKKTCHQEQEEPAEEKDSTDKSPLLSNGGENVVVVHSSSREKAKLDLRVWRFESLPRPTA